MSGVKQPLCAALDASRSPSLPLPQAARVKPVEVTTYQISVVLVEYKQEADSDWHLVVKDATGRRMVAEIPEPVCAPGSIFAAQITAARDQFAARFAPTPSWQPAGVPVTLTGVGFFDPAHGQTGGLILSGGKVTIELHPVLSVSFTTPIPSPS